MNNSELKQFIKTYEDYYFVLSEEKKKDAAERERLGLSIKHPTKRSDEKDIMAFLQKGEQNIQTIAWKMGGKKTDAGIKTQYHEYPQKQLLEFCDKTSKAELPIKNNNKISVADLRSSYDALLEIAKESNLEGYGSVYLISSMFFLSKGNVPIYDYFANVAVKALLTEMCPQDVYVGQAPSKDSCSKGNKDNKLAINMLVEYQNMLTKLAEGTDYYKNKGFISRKLDRALWVYGHALNNYFDLR